MDGDGNCLFRAVSDQIYGTDAHHRLIRHACCDYILSERDYFVQFVEGEDLKSYAERKRQDGVWADDLEIQALSEIYDRPIEIYAYRAEPMRTFHEERSGSSVIRLSYHGNEHYNSVVSLDQQQQQHVNVPIDERNDESEEEEVKESGQQPPGFYEERALEHSRSRKASSASIF